MCYVLCALFSKCRVFKVVKYDIPVCHEGHKGHENHEDISAYLHFSSFLYILLHFSTFHCISLHVSDLLCIFQHFSIFL